MDALANLDTSFFSCICDYFSDYECKELFRAVKQGVFVHEDAVDKLLDAYQKWLAQRTESSSEKSAAKCKRRIFGTEEPKLYYLIDGKLCLPGYLAPCEIGSLFKKIPVSQASMLDTNEYLHPRDPIFQSLSHVTAVMDPSKGFLLKFESKKRVFWATIDTVKQFAKFANWQDFEREESRKELKDNTESKNDSRRHERSKPLRDYVAPLQSCVIKSRPIANEHKLLIPNLSISRKANNDDKIVNYYRFQDVVFIISADNKIDYCYCVDGRNLSAFVRSEFSIAQTEFRSLLEPTRKPNPRAIGALSINKKYYLVYMKAFLKFLTMAPKTPPFKKKIPVRYCVMDALRQFVAMAREMKKINAPITSARSADVSSSYSKNSGASKGATNEIWRSGIWNMVISNTNHIIDAQFAPKRSKNKKQSDKRTIRIVASKDTTGEKTGGGTN